MSQAIDSPSTAKVVENGNTSSKREHVKIRCEECNLPFWSEEQLEKHSAAHIRRKTYLCTHCQKGFARADRLKMHERTCDKNPAKIVPRISTTMQVGRGVEDKKFYLFESALKGVLQVWRYDFSDEEQKDLYQSLHTVIMSLAYDLVNKTTGTFKWYLVLKVIFHKASNPEVISDPPAFFQTNPIVYYRKNDEDAWELVKEQLEKQIENFEQNGYGWILSRLGSLDVYVCRNR